MDRLISVLDQWPKPLEDDPALIHYLSDHDHLWKWSSTETPHFGVLEYWMRGRFCELLESKPHQTTSHLLDFSPTALHQATINVYWRYNTVEDIALCYTLLHSSSASASATGNLRFVPRSASFEDVSGLLIHEEELNGPPPNNMDDWFEVDVEFEGISLSNDQLFLNKSDACVSMRDMSLWLACENCQPRDWLLRLELLWQLQQRSMHINMHPPSLGCSLDELEKYGQMFEDACSLYKSIRELCLTPSSQAA